MHMTLHEGNEGANHDLDSLVLNPGHKHVVKVSPLKVTASPNLAAIPLSKRNCLMDSDSTSLSLFRSYSRRNCKMEKAFLKVYGSEGCIPWDMPYVVQDNATKSCQNTEGDLSKKLAEQIEEEDSACTMESCQSTIYKHSVHRQPFNGGTECRKLRKQYEKQNMSFPHNFPSKLQNLLYSIWEKSHEVKDSVQYKLKSVDACALFMENSIIVTIQPDGPTANIIHLQKKVSFTSQLAMFGEKFVSILHLAHSNIIYFRWFDGAIYRHESLERG